MRKVRSRLAEQSAARPQRSGACSSAVPPPGCSMNGAELFRRRGTLERNCAAGESPTRAECVSNAGGGMRLNRLLWKRTRVELFGKSRQNKARDAGQSVICRAGAVDQASQHKKRTSVFIAGRNGPSRNQTDFLVALLGEQGKNRIMLKTYRTQICGSSESV